jgi:hypothetical protein
VAKTLGIRLDHEQESIILNAMKEDQATNMSEHVRQVYFEAIEKRDKEHEQVVTLIKDLDSSLSALKHEQMISGTHVELIHELLSSLYLMVRDSVSPAVRSKADERDSHEYIEEHMGKIF